MKRSLLIAAGSLDVFWRWHLRDRESSKAIWMPAIAAGSLDVFWRWHLGDRESAKAIWMPAAFLQPGRGT
eukprot:9205369-Prorocentrum_lima.AAC.1